MAGFTESELSIESEANSLIIRGEKANSTQRDGAYLFQGIASRQFERRFQLADYVSVASARLENGLLHVELVREVPEAKKPRVIPIGASASQTVEHLAA